MSQYDPKFNLALQWLWGDGFLSPGGPDEIAEMLRGVPVDGRSVLDIGSGLGAASLLLVETHGAAAVHGIDVESHLVEESRDRADRRQLADRVTFELVEPGLLPFDDETYDVVFTKDSVLHIPDKPAFYAEVIRVLKPGGVFVGSDWCRGGPQTMTDRAKRWLEVMHLEVDMQTGAELSASLAAAGFQGVALNDRNAWYAETINDELAAVAGDRFEKLVELIGAEAAAYRQESSRRKQEAVADGFLRPTHFVGIAPR